MIIYLYGPDSYRRNKNLKELINAYRSKYRDIDLLVVDLGDVPDDWLKVREFLNQPSMFVESKVAVIKESNEVDKKEWIKVLKNYLKTPKIFILISDSGEPKKDFRFLLEKPVEQKYFGELAGEKLAVFLRKESAERNLEFVPEAWGYLCSFLNDSTDRTWLAINELEKIYLAGLPQPVALKDLQKLLNWLPKEEVYLMARGVLGQRDRPTRLGLLEQLFLQKEDPARIFNSLAYQARGTAAVKLSDYDISVKSGGLEYEEALLDFVIS